MRTAVIAVLLLAAMFSGSSAQPPDPANFRIIYGNRDGSPMVVSIGSLIEVPIWGATDPTPGNPDSVAFMYNPLGSANPIIPARLDGNCPDSNYEFLPPQPHCRVIGCTSQAMMFFSYLHDPRDPNDFFYTLGDTVLICTFLMRTADDSDLVGRTVYPFIDGCYGHLWGMQDGIRGVVPTQTYGGLYFTTCGYVAGDANNDLTFNGADITYALNFLKGIGPAPPAECNCPPHGMLHAAADMNGNCIFNGADIIYGLNFLRGRGSAPRRCPDCR